MINPYIFHISSVFLLLVVIAMFANLWKRSGWNRKWIPISALKFITFTIVVVCLCAGFVALLGIDRGVYAVALSLGCTLSILNPAMAVSFFVGCLILRPWETVLPDPVMTSIPKVLAFLSLASWIIEMIRRRRFHVAVNGILITTLLFFLWMFFSAMGCNDDGTSLTSLSESVFPILFLSVLLINVIEKEVDLELLIDTIVIASCGLITGALGFTLNETGALASAVRLGTYGLLGNPNDLGAVIAYSSPLLVFGFLMRRSSWTRGFFGLVFLPVLLVGLWLTQSRGSIIAILACGAAYILFCGKSLKRTLFGGLVLLVVPILVLLFLQREENEARESKTSRLNYAVTALRMIRQSPVLGVGPGNYPKLYNSFTLDFTEEGLRTAHSTWVLALAEGGIPALGLFCLLFLATIVPAWHIRQSHPEIFLSVISYGIAMTFLSHTYIFLPYLVFSLAGAAARVMRIKPKVSELRV